MKRLMLDRLHSKFTKLVKDYMQKEGVNQGELADLVGIQRTHLNMLLNGNRPLSGYYIFMFLKNGVFAVNDIYDGKSDNQREQDFWAGATEATNLALLVRIARLRKKGIDINALLDAVDPDKKPS